MPESTQPKTTPELPPKTVRFPFNHALGTPNDVRDRHRLRALKVIARFEQARTIDIAAALFPEREFKAALSAAQRTVRGLRAAKYVTKYLSDSRRVYYGLSAKGARLLRDFAYEGGDGTAQATARRVCEKTNPEHALWSAFYTIACEVRGLSAWTERELKPRYLRADQATHATIRSFPLTYQGGDGKSKGLMPDAMATLVDSDRSVIWFEIDRSARGPARLDDLVSLVKKLGTKVNMGDGETHVLRKVVIVCKTQSILRRDRTHLLGRSTAGCQLLRVRLSENTDEPALIEREPGCLDFYRRREVRKGKRVSEVVEVAGQVHLQLLPMHLSSYSYKDGAPHGWFDDGNLPFRDPDGAWAEPTPLDRS
jgi:hypothetical protein